MMPVGSERPVARVTAWLLATGDTGDVASDRHPPLHEGESVPNPHAWMGAPGYLETVSWRKQATAPEESAEVWLSPLVPVVDGEPVTHVQRLAMVVDSANGVGAALDPDEFLFMNTDTTVHLHLRVAGQGVDRTRRDRCHHSGPVRSTGLRGNVRADLAGAAALSPVHRGTRCRAV